MYTNQGPILQTDPLTTLLNKYVPRVDDRPVRDLTGDRATSDFNTLVVSCIPLFIERQSLLTRTIPDRQQLESARQDGQRSNRFFWRRRYVSYSWGT